VTQPASPNDLAPRLYVAAVSILGTACVAYCATVLIRHGVPGQWLIFAGLTFASGRFTLIVPGVDARFSVSEMTGFACVLLFGPEAGAITLAIDSVIVAFGRRMSPDKIVFNFGNLALSVWISGTLFFAASGTGPLFGLTAWPSGLVLPLGLMAAAYFGVNSGLIAFAIALSTGQRPFTVWRTHFMWLGPGYAAGACIALLLVVAHKQVEFSALALLPPVMVVSFLMLRSSFGRLDDAKVHVERLNGLYLSTIETLATAIDAKDEVTHGHIRRVQGAAVALAREMGTTDPMVLKAIEAAALLHDTGKIAVPEHILNKPGRLTPAEFEKMKLHAPIGADILSSIDFPYPVVPIVRHHHENWDGTGYPDGVRGTDIPLGARILSVVDCFDALTSDRPYRRRMTDEDALRIVLDRRGTMYDPLVVDTFAAAYQRIMPASEEAPHPAAKAVGAARSQTAMPDVPATAAGASAGAPPMLDELVAFTSLSRAVRGEAGLSDVGALVWMMVRQVVPCESIALFLHDEAADAMVARYAAGSCAAALRQSRHAMSQGVVGWTAVNRRVIVNSEATIDVPPGVLPNDVAEPHWMCAVPLVHEDSLAAVVALYSSNPMPFTEQHAQVLELLAPRLAAAIAALATRHTAADPVEALPAKRSPGADLRVVRGGRG
jgi:putative nucleotidyltransferase with HDIG domain